MEKDINKASSPDKILITFCIIRTNGPVPPLFWPLTTDLHKHVETGALGYS